MYWVITAISRCVFLAVSWPEHSSCLALMWSTPETETEYSVSFAAKKAPLSQPAVFQESRFVYSVFVWVRTWNKNPKTLSWSVSDAQVRRDNEHTGAVWHTFYGRRLIISWKMLAHSNLETGDVYQSVSSSLLLTAVSKHLGSEENSSWSFRRRMWSHSGLMQQSWTFITGFYLPYWPEYKTVFFALKLDWKSLGRLIFGV